MTKYNKISQLLIASLIIFSAQGWGKSTSTNHSSGLGDGKLFNVKYFDNGPSRMIYTSGTKLFGGVVCNITDNTGNYKEAILKWKNSDQMTNYTYTDNGIVYPIKRTSTQGVGVIFGATMKFGATPGKFDTGTKLVPISDIPKNITPTVPSPELTSDRKSLSLNAKFWALVTIPGEDIIAGSHTIGQSDSEVAVQCIAEQAVNNNTAYAYLRGSTVNVTAPTCTVTAPNTNIALGTYDLADIRARSINDTFADKGSQITLDCPANTYPKLKITDNNRSTEAEENAGSNIANLSNKDTAAQGLGVQVFLDGEAQKVDGTEIDITPARLTQRTNFTFNPVFKYIKTSSDVRAGKANAVITFTFSYY